MVYEWACLTCDSIMEVIRDLSEYMRPPGSACPLCLSSSYKKVIVTPPTIALKEAHNSPFPLTVPGLEKGPRRNPDGSVFLGEDGLPRMEYRSVTFKDEKHQASYLKERGLCLVEDGRDQLNNGSQKSVYDPYDPPPPSEMAVEIHRQARFVEYDEAVKLSCGRSE